MNIRGLNLAQFTAFTERLSGRLYSGNVVVAQDSRALPPSKYSYPIGRALPGLRMPGQARCVARLAVRDSHGPGSRTSWTGRHGPYACWHAYRDVLAEVFEQFPDATIRTALATYRSRAGFLADYPATGIRNAGSELSPVTMPELCQCSEIQFERVPVTSYSAPGLLDCPVCGRANGQYSSTRTLNLHLSQSHPCECDACGEYHRRNSSRIAREEAREEARIAREKRMDENEFLINDPVFGPRLVKGQDSGTW